jgi:ribose transport system substrate-binding protein
MHSKYFQSAAGAAMIFALLGGAAHAKGKTFALIQYNQQVSFFTDITKGAQKAADEEGDKLVVFDANNSASAQARVDP